jgi:hypothetical protein
MFTGKQWVAVSSIGVAAFTGGAALGHFLTVRKVRKDLEEVLEEIENEPYVPRSRVREMTLEEFISPDAQEAQIGRRHLSAIPNLEYEKVDEAAPVETVVNVFSAETNDDWDYEAERNTRESLEIYVIHKDEFFGNEMHFKQATLTWYEADEVLVDELDKPIYAVSNLLGDRMIFGHGSGDPNVVYVRNEREQMEWEVIRDPGLYAVEVLGLEVEHDYEKQDLKHSVRRFVME